MKNFLKSLFGQSESVRSKPSKPSFKPQMERLEDRLCMSTSWTVGFDSQGNILQINGDGGNDTVLLQEKLNGVLHFKLLNPAPGVQAEEEVSVNRVNVNLGDGANNLRYSWAPGASLSIKELL